MILTRFAAACAFWALSLLAQAQPELKTKFVATSDGVRLHYIEAGAGPAILFVPGLAMPAEIWQSQVHFFASQHRVVALDPRSQGESDKVAEGHFPEKRAKDIKEVIDALQLSPVVVVGWSMGGPEALTYVAQFGSENLKALVLVDSVIGDGPDPARAAGHFRTTKMIQSNRAEWTGAWVRSMFAKPQSPEFLQRLTQTALRTPTNTMVLLILNTYVADGDDRRPMLSKVNKPVLYVGRSASRRQAENVKQALPAARVEIFEGAGHALFVDEPERFNKLLADFLASL
jgi:non-heme chloroperoxidase